MSSTSGSEWNAVNICKSKAMREVFKKAPVHESMLNFGENAEREAMTKLANQ